jgi:hypothetical protein
MKRPVYIYIYICKAFYNVYIYIYIQSVCIYIYRAFYNVLRDYKRL